MVGKYIHELSSEEIREAVADKYGEIAQTPEAKFPFPVGRAFAESQGYLPKDLDGLPTHAVNAFAGISCLHPYQALCPGKQVLDLGCGAGLDSILMAGKVLPDGQIHGLDASATMIAAARDNAASAQVNNIIFHHAPAEHIPLEENTMDVVAVNGILNLCASKKAVLAEIRRVLKDMGQLYLSEIVRQDEAAEPQNSEISLESWFL
jgi:2-polyprenyl-3-methyl-5-hydroxy-6-metoxy-1,4-benzoquinol methylase